jgi:hypothetical protein
MLEGFDFRWNERTMATETIAMYTLSLSHDRNAALRLVRQTYSLVNKSTYFFH